MSISTRERKHLREKYGIPQDKTVFVYGGNLGRPQGIPFIIKCLEKLKGNKRAYFLIVGDGTEFEKLKDFFDKEKPENMKLMSKLPKDDYDTMIAACDVGLIFLDHRFTIPNFPSRLLSYMQAKLPVLAATDPNTDIGKEITEGGFGWWCESNDVDAFSKLVENAFSVDLEQMRTKEIKYLMENYTVSMAYENIKNKIGG
jgi:putative glycosyltransferase